MTNRRLTVTMMVLGLFAVTCGGTVVEREGDAGSSGEAGSGGSGTGGVTSKGGTGPGGATSTGGTAGYAGYAGVAGAGNQGGWAGTGAYGGWAGSGAQGGWAGSGGSVCPPLPSCNWCNGNPYYDSTGCIMGWTCANGADPCSTQPCWNTGCPMDQVCGSDGLCWYTNDPCSPKSCAGTSNYCECSWSCGATKYLTKCKVGGSSVSCECVENGMNAMGCGTAGGGGGSPPSCQNSCCGFPE